MIEVLLLNNCIELFTYALEENYLNLPSKTFILVDDDH